MFNLNFASHFFTKKIYVYFTFCFLSANAFAQNKTKTAVITGYITTNIHATVMQILNDDNASEELKAEKDTIFRKLNAFPAEAARLVYDQIVKGEYDTARASLAGAMKAQSSDSELKALAKLISKDNDDHDIRRFGVAKLAVVEMDGEKFGALDFVYFHVMTKRGMEDEPGEGAYTYTVKLRTPLKSLPLLATVDDIENFQSVADEALANTKIYSWEKTDGFPEELKKILLKDKK